MQLGGETAIVLFGAPAAAGAGDRPGDDPAVVEAAPSARARPDDGDLGVAHEVHVGARVDLTQHPIDVERIGVELEAEPLRQHHLEDVAGEDVLLGHLDGRGSTAPCPSTR